MDWLNIEIVEEMAPDDWVLCVIDWNEPFKRPSVRLAYWDKYDKKWRTQMGRLEPHWKVTHWMPLPEPPTGT